MCVAAGGHTPHPGGVRLRRLPGQRAGGPDHGYGGAGPPHIRPCAKGAAPGSNGGRGARPPARRPRPSRPPRGVHPRAEGPHLRHLLRGRVGEVLRPALGREAAAESLRGGEREDVALQDVSVLPAPGSDDMAARAWGTPAPTLASPGLRTCSPSPPPPRPAPCGLCGGSAQPPRQGPTRCARCRALVCVPPGHTGWASGAPLMNLGHREESGRDGRGPAVSASVGSLGQAGAAATEPAQGTRARVSGGPGSRCRPRVHTAQGSGAVGGAARAAVTPTLMAALRTRPGHHSPRAAAVPPHRAHRPAHGPRCTEQVRGRTPRQGHPGPLGRLDGDGKGLLSPGVLGSQGPALWGAASPCQQAGSRQGLRWPWAGDKDATSFLEPRSLPGPGHYFPESTARTLRNLRAGRGFGTQPRGMGTRGRLKQRWWRQRGTREPSPADELAPVVSVCLQTAQAALDSLLCPV